MAPTSCDTCKSLITLFLDGFILNCHMQQSALGKGNFADSLFHNAVCFPFAVIV